MSAGLAFDPRAGGGAAIVRLAGALRRPPTPAIGRIDDGRLILDLRCLEDEEAFAANLARLRLDGDDAAA
jgi:L-seryl-tRNA(Ser) seleniumtransferase